MTAAADGRQPERRVEEWLRRQGLRPERFSARRRKTTKTPDFRVSTPRDESFLVEVKRLANPAPGRGAVALKLIRARAQFDAVNQGGHLANVLALVVPSPPALLPILESFAAVHLPNPLQGVDLVVGLADDGPGGAARLLHDAVRPRHRAVLAANLELEPPLADPEGRP
ncbi:MAG: hypothetical protein AAFX81_03700 [Pseudomonadota bacterium]